MKISPQFQTKKEEDLFHLISKKLDKCVNKKSHSEIELNMYEQISKGINHNFSQGQIVASVEFINKLFALNTEDDEDVSLNVTSIDNSVI